MPVDREDAAESVDPAGSVDAAAAGTAAGGGSQPALLTVPNFSEGRNPEAIVAIAGALASGTPGARLLDTHSDPDHDRSVYTLCAAPAAGGSPTAGGALAAALVAGAAEAVARIDLTRHRGAHPRVGALDVAPIVYLHAASRGAACAEALIAADRLAEELELPVFLYGEITGERAVTRAAVRRGGTAELGRRIDGGELIPDFGPRRLHPTAGAALVGARPPLIAFNVELEPPADLQTARRIAGLIREGGGESLAGVRAIGLTLPSRGGIAQVSTNIEDFGASSPAAVVDAVGRHAVVARAEIIGLPPRAAFADFPPEIELRNRRCLEDALADSHGVASK